MILRNNGDTLIVAPSLNISREEIDVMIGKLNEVLDVVTERFDL